MNFKLILFLALVLSGVLFGCSSGQKKIDVSGHPAYGEENQILALKDKLWDAVHTKDVAKFVDCYFIEERFDTAQVREANRKQVEKFLQGEIIDMEVFEIPPKELEQIVKIQDAYSLVPKKMLEIRGKATGGWSGWRLLIGTKNGKWHIITLAGYTT